MSARRKKLEAKYYPYGERSEARLLVNSTPSRKLSSAVLSAAAVVVATGSDAAATKAKTIAKINPICPIATTKLGFLERFVVFVVPVERLENLRLATAG